MSNSTNTNEIISLNTNSILNLNMSNVSKLTSTNYLMWSLQVHALLDGYALAKHLDSTMDIPAATLTTADVVSDNPEFIHWTRQDKLTTMPSLVLSHPRSNLWSHVRRQLLRSGRNSLKPMRNRVGDISNSSVISCVSSPKVPKLLTSIYKVSLPNLINSPSLANHTIMKTKWRSFLEGFLKNTRLLLIRLKGRTLPQASLKFMKDYSIMKPSSLLSKTRLLRLLQPLQMQYNIVTKPTTIATTTTTTGGRTTTPTPSTMILIVNMRLLPTSLKHAHKSPILGGASCVTHRDTVQDAALNTNQLSSS